MLVKEGYLDIHCDVGPVELSEDALTVTREEGKATKVCLLSRVKRTPVEVVIACSKKISLSKHAMQYVLVVHYSKILLWFV